MAKSRCFIVTVITLVLVLCHFHFADGSLAANKSYDMHIFCENEELFSNNMDIHGTVLSMKSDGTKDKMECRVVFKSGFRFEKLMVRFQRLDMDCDSHLYIYDSAYVTPSYLADISCHNTTSSIGILYPKFNYVTFQYTRPVSTKPASSEFNVVITAFKNKYCDFFCCQNGFCISNDLVLDGVNHCGDNSDESTNSTEVSNCSNGRKSVFMESHSNPSLLTETESSDKASLKSEVQPENSASLSYGFCSWTVIFGVLLSSCASLLSLAS